MSRVPATDGLQPAVFDAAASTFACDANRDDADRTACGPSLRRIEGMTRAQRAIFFIFRHSSLRARPTVVEPVPGRAVYHAAWSMPRTPPNNVCLHAPPSFMLCVRQGAWRLSRRPRAASVERAPFFVWTGGACRWRAPRPSLPVALASLTRSVDPLRGWRPATSTRAACRVDDMEGAPLATGGRCTSGRATCGDGRQ